MADPEINGAWEAKLESDQEEQAQRQADRAWHAEILERRKVTQERAQKVVDAAGINRRHLENHAQDVYDWQVSNDVPLGRLEAVDPRGRAYAFATVYIARDKRRETVEHRGLFSKHTERVEVVTDKVNQITVRLSAGREDGSDQVPFEFNHWSITQGDDDEGLSRVERRLDHLAGVLGISLSEEQAE